MSLGEEQFEFAALENVVIDDAFWAPRMRVNREITIPLQYDRMKATGRIDGFDLNWTPGEGQRRHQYHDSDVAKWVEAVSCSLMTHPDPKLDALLNEVVDLIAGAQLPDGYLNTYYSVMEPENRWTNLYDGHELYQAGHLIEAAVAHFRATGKTSLLDVARRYADYIDRVFGPEPGKKRGYCGHPEIELALVKLYRATGSDRYLKLSKYFVDERGRQPYYYDAEAIARGQDPSGQRAKSNSYEYMQARIPIREQREIAGHAVMAMYLYSAVSDLVREFGDEGLSSACHHVWNNLTSKRLYVHGGVGSTRSNEGFTTDYDLPNETAYAETCAAIGLVFWAHRMLQNDCDSRYSDVMERALYNGFLSSYSLDGTRFFYENRLASLGNHHRQEWFWCACCPPNYARLMASLGQYVYSCRGTEAAIHLYVQGSVRLDMSGRGVTLRQKTKYPWEGTVRVSVETEKPLVFGLRLRIPGWAREAMLSVSGKQVDIEERLRKGYVRIEREWSAGDTVEIDLPMPVERVRAHPDVRADFGRVGLQRGPLVYCLEEIDNPAPPHRIILPENSKISAQFESGLLDGVVVIEGDALAADDAGWNEGLYIAQERALKPCKIKAIPYYAWDNRQPGQMIVWLTVGG
ncbi:MAG: glycoside hydrolase family 127 protein [Armatimonadota bacterium]|nr:glycoside hydrolase family 127 protein [Armatimonadota bacterium]